MLLALRCNSYIIMKIFSCCLVLFCLLPGRIDAACEVSNGGCSPGKYCSSSKNDNGDQLCLSCDPGLYQNAKSTVLNQCKMCPKGKYNTNHNSKASSACLQCQRGQYVAQDGSSSCKNCPSGTYGDRKGLNSESSCRPCALGRYNDSPAGDSPGACKSCSSGQYSDSTTGSTDCTICPGKKVSLPATTRSSKCTAVCPAGSYKVSGNCLVCPTGQYSKEPGSSGCTKCLLGTFPGAASNGHWNDCAAGEGQTCECDGLVRRKKNDNSYQVFSVHGGIMCSTDSFGFNSNGACACRSLAVKCHQCDVGKYAADAGSASCSECSPGFYTDVKGGRSCKECELGRSQLKKGMSQCVKCGSGKYAKTSSLGCENCPKGTFSIQQTNLACKVCEAGKRSENSVGSTKCELCTARYSPPGSDQCFGSCPAGTIKSSAQRQCLVCPSGKYQSLLGQSQCIQCDFGTYLADPGTDYKKHNKKSQCLGCSPGKYSLAGSQNCGGADRLRENPDMYYPWNLQVEVSQDRSTLFLSGCLSSPRKREACIGESATNFDITGLYVETSTDINFGTDSSLTTRKEKMETAEAKNKTFIITMNVSMYNIVRHKLYIRAASFTDALEEERSKFSSGSLWETSDDCEQRFEYLDIVGDSPGNREGDQVVPAKPTTWKCRPCPVGAGCVGVETWKDVRAKYGYWRFVEKKGDTRSTKFIECPRHEACLGSENLDPSFAIVDASLAPPASVEMCNSNLGYRVDCDGSMCPLCSVCEDGYYTKSFARCEKCPGIVEASLFAAGAVVMAACLIGFMVSRVIGNGVFRHFF
jgi:hypothetical protein